MSDRDGAGPPRWRDLATLRPVLLLLVPVLAGAAGFLALGPDIWSADAILARRDQLATLAAAAPGSTLAIFALVYFAIVSSAVPVGPPMSLIAGFLFGRWLGSGTILLAATAGALVVYRLGRLSGRSPAGARLLARAGPLAEQVGEGLRTNAFGWILVMRLIPVFPFFLVNVVAGLFSVPVTAFTAATLLGRIPAVFAYVSLGERLGRVSSLRELASPEIVVNLTVVGLLALVPVLAVSLRRARARRSGADRED